MGLPLEDRERLTACVEEMAKKGDSDAVIAGQLDISPRSARRLRHEAGLLLRPTPGPPVPDADLAAAYDALTESLGRPPSAEEVAARTGLKVRSVQQRVHQLRKSTGKALRLTPRPYGSAATG